MSSINNNNNRDYDLEIGKQTKEQQVQQQGGTTAGKHLKWKDELQQLPSRGQEMKRRNDDNDDEDYDEEEEEEECYDPKTGKRVITAHMSEETKREIIEQQKRDLEAISKPQLDYKITPIAKRKSVAERRLLSQQALAEARHDVAVALGSPCPVVHDPDSGYTLPRDSIVTNSKPIEIDDGEGNLILVSPPATGWLGTPDEIEIQKKKLLEERTRVHHASSYRVLEEMRMRKLMREMGDLSKEFDEGRK